ncbi:hypothetical protein ISN45_At01g029780 [Arabidopsis thaliana x Arabidopsis arenosa]|uniref:Uncharacterized protein n=2 Tax=Arabidopsis TaxID=3701 RepID=A0A8T2H6N5_ARASU|nr:hypothetical protein ISN45_At01g029780 [Arabidopsis thaliana x Arabidopsis arenosa]KAG7655909.1 hypothetical protein ISN44_As01g029430 [Arabidopsis suecica]
MDRYSCGALIKKGFRRIDESNWKNHPTCTKG